jgi:hypothetical protein
VSAQTNFYHILPPPPLTAWLSQTEVHLSFLISLTLPFAGFNLAASCYMHANPPIPNSEKPSILLVTYYRIIEASIMVECWKEMIQLRFTSLFLTILCSIPSNPIQMDSHWIVSQHPSCSHILHTGEPSYNSAQRHTHTTTVRDHCSWTHRAALFKSNTYSSTCIQHPHN